VDIGRRRIDAHDRMRRLPKPPQLIVKADVSDQFIVDTEGPGAAYGADPDKQEQCCACESASASGPAALMGGGGPGGSGSGAEEGAGGGWFSAMFQGQTTASGATSEEVGRAMFSPQCLSSG